MRLIGEIVFGAALSRRRRFLRTDELAVSLACQPCFGHKLPNVCSLARQALGA